MARSQRELFSSRDLLPHFVTMFFGAMNDALYRSAMVIYITYRLAESSALGAGILVTAAGGVLVAPFFIFSALAGQMSKKFGRTAMIRATKLAEVVCMVLGGVAFYIGSVWMLTVVLFLMGTQSAFFGPLKFGVLPALVAEDELLAANGIFEMGTFIAVLIGAIAGGSLAQLENGALLASGAVVTSALVGLAASMFIPRLGAIDPSARLSFRIVADTKDLLRASLSTPAIRVPTLGVSWFYFVGSLYFAQFPIYAHSVYNGDGGVATFLMAAFSVGIGVGSTLCGAMFKIADAPRTSLGSGIVIAIAGGALWAVSPDAPPEAAMSVWAFITSPACLASLLCLCVISAGGGIFLVPINTMIQVCSGAEDAPREVAALNVISSLFMTAASAAGAILLALGASIPFIFMLAAVATAPVGLWLFLSLSSPPTRSPERR